MKKKFLLAVAMLLFLALAVLTLAKVFGPRTAAVDAVIQAGDDTVVLYPLAPDEENRYTLRIDTGDEEKRSTLILAAMRPFDALIQGEQVYSYRRADHYQRLHVIPLPDHASDTEVTIISHSGQKNLKLMLAPLRSVPGYINQARLLSVFLIGIQASILFVCGTLYWLKRTEKYLLAEMLAVSITLISALLTSGVFSLPVSEGQYVYIQYVIDAIRIPVLQAVGILLIPLPDRPLFTWYKKNVTAITLCASAFLLILYLARLGRLAGHLAHLFWLLTAVACVSALAAREPCMLLFTFGYLMRYALSLYTTMTNIGLLPNTPFLIYFYIPQLNNLLFILPCVYLVCHRYTHKYVQAEEMADQLREINQQLDQKVEARTRELVEQQNKRRNMMINIFHDLRSPIFAARGCADMLIPHDADDAETLEIIKSKLDFLSTLTEQLFLSAKLEENQVTFAAEPVDLSSLCDHIVRESEPQMNEKGLEAVQKIDPAIWVVGDGFRLKQAIENLLSNAIAFTPRGGRITLVLRLDEGNALLSVADSGVGIAQADIPHVFERYYQGKNSNKQRSSGLGLFIAADIVKKHGGDIRVESTPGHGAVFEIRLNLSDPSAP
ncbi:MAG: HAMP domain-containing histidine kinase [Clostridia bacterium]|nr:HAMP domain-containing histidine kinase [Clostridia bacterium]